MNSSDSKASPFLLNRKGSATVAAAAPAAAPAVPRKKASVGISALALQATPLWLGMSAFALALFPIEWRYLWGEATYVATGQNLFSGSLLYNEIASIPPLLPLLLHAGSRVMSLDLFCRLLAAAFFAATVVLVFLLGRKLYGYAAGLCAALLMLSSPFFVFWGHKVIPEIPATALLLGSVYCLFLQLEDGRKSWWRALLAGALLSAAFMTQWTTALGVLIALYFVASRRLKLASLAFAGAALIAVAPYLLWDKIHQGAFLWPVWHTLVTDLGSDPTPDRFYYLKAIYIICGPLALFGLFGYLFALVTRQRDDVVAQTAEAQVAPNPLASRFLGKDLPLLLWLLVFLGCLSLAAHKDSVYILPAMPALYLLAGRGFSGMRGALAKVAILAVPLGLFYVATHLTYFQAREKWMDSMLEYSGEMRAAALYVRDNAPDTSVIYSNHLWPVAAYYSKRPTVVLWPRDGRFYHAYPKNMTGNGFFVFCRDVGKEPGERWLDERPEFHKLKDYGEVVLYQYKYSGEGVLTPELTQQIDDAKKEFDAGAYDKVINALISVHFPDMEVANLRGWSYYRLGMIPEASESFRAGLRAEPDNPRNLLGLGYCELRLGDPQGAQRHFRTALNQVPDAVDAMVGLGLASMRLGDNATAEDQFRKALQIDPQNEEVRKYLQRAQSP